MRGIGAPEPTVGTVSSGGSSSRIHRTSGPHQTWMTTNGIGIELPVIVTWTRPPVHSEAIIDLVGGRPALISVVVSGRPLDALVLQQRFRWHSPLEVVTGIMPQLIAIGEDPYTTLLPMYGYPAIAVQPHPNNLSDDFLRTIAAEYLIRGRGYARSLAKDYVVSERTVVSWIEKARQRRILSSPPAVGAHGGQLLPYPAPPPAV